MRHLFPLIAAMLPVLSMRASAADVITVTDEIHHLRSNDEREWVTFPAQAEGNSATFTFQASVVDGPTCLELRQEDVKQSWRIMLNDREVAKLHRDENAMRVYFELPTGSIKDGTNKITVESTQNRIADDIHAGPIRIHRLSKTALLEQSRVVVHVHEQQPPSTSPSTSPSDHVPFPCRITVVDHQGSLQEVAARPLPEVAVRPGTVYSSTGRVELSLPVGDYDILAGRGFEYSLARSHVTTIPDDARSLDLTIARVVPTQGWIACDPHVHTLTHSGHGDATVLERMITLAGEGIELPIATDHNVQIDHEPFARQAGVRRFFTPVCGNEVTTTKAHFNVFPAIPSAPVPDHRQDTWSDTFTAIDRSLGIKVIILNHARDLHSGVRPFGPRLFNDASGVNVKGWQLRANAMEVVNSGANQTNILQLFQDWMTLLNRGHAITPVGSSDSHDVARHFVGQGRTYIRSDDSEPGNIDVDTAVRNFLQGQVMVSYGLLTSITVDGKYSCGELARPNGDSLHVRARIMKPEWIEADRIRLFANGELIRDDVLTWPTEPGTCAHDAEWTIPRPSHDVHLVAIATGPGVAGVHWRTAKPYQPASPEWESATIGCSGAVWVDNDGNSRRTPAVDYARNILANVNGDNQLAAAIPQLSRFDASIAIQVASLVDEETGQLPILMDDPSTVQALQSAPIHVRSGFEQYLAARRRVTIATLENQ